MSLCVPMTTAYAPIAVPLTRFATAIAPAATWPCQSGASDRDDHSLLCASLPLAAHNPLQTGHPRGWSVWVAVCGKWARRCGLALGRHLPHTFEIHGNEDPFGFSAQHLTDVECARNERLLAFDPNGPAREQDLAVQRRGLAIANR